MDATEKTDVTAICLQNAVLCADCEVISDSTHETCRVCGSHSLLSLSRVLGGTLPVQRAQLVEAWESNYEEPALSRRLALVRRASA
jgi:anaerobic ribonucleoside-triphosphate reductase